MPSTQMIVERSMAATGPSAGSKDEREHIIAAVPVLLHIMTDRATSLAACQIADIVVEGGHTSSYHFSD